MKRRRYSHLLVSSTILLVVVLTGCSNVRNNSPADCVGDDCKQALIAALEDLDKIRFVSKSDEVIEAERQRVRQIVERFREPRHLATLALLTRAMRVNCGFDAICSKESTNAPSYDNAFWDCIKLLAKDRSGNERLLQYLKEAAVLNDTERGDWGRIVEGKEFP